MSATTKDRLTPLKATAQDQEPDFVIVNFEEDIMVFDETNEPVFDYENKLVGASSNDIIKNQLWHRSNRVFIMDEMNNFYVQKRSMDKQICPGYYDLMMGGKRKVSCADDKSAVIGTLVE